MYTQLSSEVIAMKDVLLISVCTLIAALAVLTMMMFSDTAPQEAWATIGTIAQVSAGWSVVSWFLYRRQQKQIQAGIDAAAKILTTRMLPLLLCGIYSITCLASYSAPSLSVLA
jgi:hypothetical protein